ncbi:MAG: hypothetical protein H7Y11_03030 [Armatimonadetes bacterium]|nr:hypothetical protein [Anaerolineae bacterium]
MTTIHDLDTTDRLDELLDLLDTLHTAVSENQLHTVTLMSQRDLLGALREVVFTAQETITELEARAGRKTKPAQPPTPLLRIVPKEVVPAETRHA